MNLQELRKIVVGLLQILDRGYGTDGVYKEIEIFSESCNPNEVSRYILTIKGERDKGTPFYCGSETTHICKESYVRGELVYAEILLVIDSENNEKFEVDILF